MKFCWSSSVAGDFSMCYPFHHHHNSNNTNNSKVNLITIDLDGIMVVPHYKIVPRAACRLLTLAWERRWDDLIRQCDRCPQEAFFKTEHSGRTALHLATFNDGCSLEAAVALLKANRHALVVEDKNCYTPLHNLGLFHGGDNLMSLFCDTAIMVEQELQQGRQRQRLLPDSSRTSPLYLAAKRDAPTSTLRLLLQTRARSSCQWIAPVSGGESYWDPQQTLDKCSSPLEILLRGRGSCFVGISNITKQQMATMARQHLMTTTHNNNNAAAAAAGDRKNKNNNYNYNHHNLNTHTASSSAGATTKEDIASSVVADDSHDQAAITMWEKCLLFLKENVRTTTSVIMNDGAAAGGDNNHNGDVVVVDDGNGHTTNSTQQRRPPPNQQQQQQQQVVQVPSLLHTVASLKVPTPLLLQLAMDLFVSNDDNDHGLFWRDDTGKYPLYHILKSNHPYATKQLLTIILSNNNYNTTTTNDNDNTSSTTPAATKTTTTTSNIRPYPLDCIQECLLLAIKTGLTWDGGLQNIVMANSEALIVQDPKTKLVPALFAASQDSALDTIFLLLLAEPQVVVV